MNLRIRASYEQQAVKSNDEYDKCTQDWREAGSGNRDDDGGDGKLLVRAPSLTTVSGQAVPMHACWQLGASEPYKSRLRMISIWLLAWSMRT
jgi:hypothetical protein